MAVTALRSQGTKVLIVCFVATIALRGQLQPCRRCRVAALAFRGAVLSTQGVSGVSVVIERGFPRFHAMT